MTWGWRRDAVSGVWKSSHADAGVIRLEAWHCDGVWHWQVFDDREKDHAGARLAEAVARGSCVDSFVDATAAAEREGNALSSSP